MNTKNILGLDFADATMDEALKSLDNNINKPGCYCIYTPNAEFLLLQKKDPYFKSILKDANLLLPDGMGVMLASKIIKKPLKSKISGVDFVKEILKNKSYKIYLYGAKPNILDACVKNIQTKHPNITIAGYTDGYNKELTNKEIANKINQSEADIVLVALGSPKQEQFIHEQQLSVSAAIGVGGTFDIISGYSILAPDWIRKSGFEWLYRAFKEPKRFKRIIRLPLVIIDAIIFRIQN